MFLASLDNCFIPASDTAFTVDFGGGLLLWGVPGAYYAGFYEPLRLTARKGVPCMGVPISNKNVKKIRREMAAVRENDDSPAPELRRIRAALLAKGVRGGSNAKVRPSAKDDVAFILSFPTVDYTPDVEVFNREWYSTEPLAHGFHALRWNVVQWVEAGAPSFPIR